MEHSEVVFRLFSPTGEQVTETIEPRVGPLHDPAPGLLARFFSLRFLPSGPNVGRVAKGGHHLAHLVKVVACVQAHVLVVARRPMRVAGGFGRR